jgi:CRISPR system Cascade subunit CasA
MNLIFDPWIPVVRKGGSRQSIAPWQLTEAIDADPALAVASPRPDFDGALTQFLIGLLQTTCMPPDDDAWYAWREVPPSLEELKARFATVSEAFELEGERAFMQDYAPAELTTVCGIAALLIDAPGEKTREENRDHFVKALSDAALCADCVATALLTLQLNAPAGGQGHRTGLRGGGPLSTVVLGRTLWETCWLNVLVEARYPDKTGPAFKANPASVFPWLGATRTSEGKPPAGVTTFVDVSAHQQYWPMPRRIRLTPDARPFECATCGRRGERGFRYYTTRNFGVNYDGFEHPLTPHYLKEGAPNPVHPQPGGLGYRHWIGLVENDADGTRRRARVIEQFLSLNENQDARLWAFGFDMDNMKPRCWYSATMPIVSVPRHWAGLFSAMVERMVGAAHLVARELGQQVKAALFGKGADRVDIEFVRQDFWAETEAAFYSAVFRLRDSDGDQASEHLVMEHWLKAMARQAHVLFERHTGAGQFDAVDPGQVATAYNELIRALNGRKLRERLGLPVAAAALT